MITCLYRIAFSFSYCKFSQGALFHIKAPSFELIGSHVVMGRRTLNLSAPIRICWIISLNAFKAAIWRVQNCAICTDHGEK